MWAQQSALCFLSIILIVGVSMQNRCNETNVSGWCLLEFHFLSTNLEKVILEPYNSVKYFSGNWICPFYKGISINGDALIFYI